MESTNSSGIYVPYTATSSMDIETIEKKRKRDEFEQNSPNTPNKDARIENLMLGNFNAIPIEATLHVFSFIDGKDLQNITVLNSYMDSLIKQEELLKLRKFINDIKNLDPIINYPGVVEDLTELNKSIVVEDCLSKEDFNPTEFLKSTHDSLINILSKVRVRDLVKINLESLSVPHGFANFLNIVILVRMSHELYSFPILYLKLDLLKDEDKEELTHKSRSELYDIYIYGLQLYKTVQSGEYSELQSQLKRVSDFDRIRDNPKDIYPSVVEVINFSKEDKSDLEIQNFILSKLDSLFNETQMISASFDIDIHANIYFLLNFFNQFELAKKHLVIMPFRETYYYKAPFYFKKLIVISLISLFESGNFEKLKENLLLINNIGIANEIIIRLLSSDFKLHENIEKALELLQLWHQNGKNTRGKKSLSYLHSIILNSESPPDSFKRAIQWALSLPLTNDKKLLQLRKVIARVISPHYNDADLEKLKNEN